jgi:hypothetical protein
MNYERIAIAFLAIRGKDIIDSFPFSCDDDEVYLVFGLKSLRGLLSSTGQDSPRILLLTSREWLMMGKASCGQICWIDTVCLQRRLQA